MIFEKSIKIGNKEINENSHTYIIAEAGVNHNGDIELAKKMIDEAVNLNVDAIKFQAFKTEGLILSSIEKAEYQKVTTGENETQFEMLKKLEVSKNKLKELKEYSASKGVHFLVTPFDEESLEELEEIGLDAYKISSTDLTNLPFLRKIALKEKPIILSTGMSYLCEVEEALKEIYKINKKVIILQCTANYPVIETEVNLSVMNLYKEQFNILVGFSDHTEGIGASPYAVALGAKVIEKHYTLDKNLEGPDQSASLNPREFKALVSEIRKVEKYVGSRTKIPQVSELGTRKSLQKNLVARREIREGEIFSDENIVAKRTGGEGVSPMYSNQVFGTLASKSYELNEIIK